MRRRAEPAVGAIDLEAGGAVADEAEITDALVGADALEDEGRARIEAVGPASVVGADVEALRGEAGADQRLRRAAVAPPQAAILSGEAVIVLAGLGCPGADAPLGAAHLDDARQLAMEGDAPVEAIGAEIHQPAALFGEFLDRVEHATTVILRMR